MYGWEKGEEEEEEEGGGEHRSDWPRKKQVGIQRYAHFCSRITHGTYEYECMPTPHHFFLQHHVFEGATNISQDWLIGMNDTFLVARLIGCY